MSIAEKLGTIHKSCLQFSVDRQSQNSQNPLFKFEEPDHTFDTSKTRIYEAINDLTKVWQQWTVNCGLMNDPLLQGDYKGPWVCDRRKYYVMLEQFYQFSI